MIAARTWFETRPDVASSTILADGQVEIGFRGDEEATAALLRDAVGSGLRIASFARAASDLEELFLQVTGHDGEAARGATDATEAVA